jgi:hypothetical protein
MAKSKRQVVRALASRWSPPDALPEGVESAGEPLACVATTYTFHSALFEADLLPRFLGLRFDDAEGDRPFFVEREQALGMARVCVLVDQDHVDPAQTTLRWDQMPVRVPGGAQHAKVVLLAWERCVRLTVSSANLTRTGYRRNREVASSLDFFDHPSSAPRRTALDALDFLGELATWARGTVGAVERLQAGLQDVRRLLAGWGRMPDDFTTQEMPRVVFVPGLPARDGNERRSPLDQALDLWGGRRATEVVVLTPFVGASSGEADPVVDRLRGVPHGREAVARLVVPGQPSQDDPSRMVVRLPRRFRDAWAAAWNVETEAIPVHVVPPCRPDGVENAHRELHAKGLLLVAEKTTLLLCGSSNFSPHGMGVGAANAEANLCFLDRSEARAEGMSLRDRLLDGWPDDEASSTIWPEEAPPQEEDPPPGATRLPAVFLWASLDQQANTLTLGLDPGATPPPQWLVRLPGAQASQLPPLVDHRQVPAVPADGRVAVSLPDALRSVTLTCVAVTWRDGQGEGTALLPVQVESPDDLLPPEEFRAMTADAILACLLSGRDPAEWVEHEQQGRQRRGGGCGANDSLDAVDTSAYALYRVRRLGRALAVLGDRILRTVRTRDALNYRLRQDPLGPCLLAEALLRQAKEEKTPSGPDRPDTSALRFCLAELCLTVAHVGQRLGAERQEGDPDLRPLFAEALAHVEGLGEQLREGAAHGGESLEQYIAAVRQQCRLLIGASANGGGHAG